jgi:hypothetical protein
MGKMKDLVCHDTPPSRGENLCIRCESYDESIEGDNELCVPCQEEAAWDAHQTRLAEWAG